MSGISETKPLVSTENCCWYRLGGVTKAAVKRAMELDGLDPGTHDPAELESLACLLGLRTPVLRNTVKFGPAAEYPVIFLVPANGEDEFFMMCPRPSILNSKPAEFVPDESIEMSHEGAAKLRHKIFTTKIGQTPVTYIEPFPLKTHAHVPSPETPELS